MQREQNDLGTPLHGAHAPDAILAGLSGLASLARATNELARGTGRVRAAAAIVGAYARIDAATLDRSQRAARARAASATWTSLGLDCLTRAVDALAPRALTAPFDCGAELLRTATSRALAPDGSTSRDARRWALLIDGAALRGRLAVLHRVATEVATHPDQARALAAAAPLVWRADAERIVATGCVVDRRGQRFVGDLADPRYPASLARATALADAGEVDALRRCVAAIEPAGRADRAAARPLEAVALWRAGDVPAARHALRRLGRADEDRARLRMASHEISRGRTDLAASIADAIAAAPLQHRALSSVLVAELARGVARRDLVRRVVSRAEPLEAALVRTELALLDGRDDEATDAIARVGALLRACSRPVTTLGHEPPLAWERAILAAATLAIRGLVIPSSLAPTRAVVRPVARRPSFAAALWRVVEARGEPLQRVLERLPDTLVAVRELLRAERLRRAADANQVGVALAALDADALAALAAPLRPSDAALAGVMGVPARVASDPTDAARAAFDYGTSLSPRIAARRTILLNACAPALQTDHLTDEALRWREGCLRQLEGAALASALVRILETRPLTGPWVRTAIALAGRAEPKRVLACAFRRFDEMTAGGRRLPAILGALERERALSTRFANALHVLSARSPSRAFARWWQEFSTSWAERAGRAVHEAVAVLLLEPASRELLSIDGSEAVAHVARSVERSLRASDILASDAGSMLSWAAALRDPHPEAAWSDATWRMRIDAARRSGNPHSPTVRRFVSGLQAALRSRATGALLAGGAPTAELAEPVPIGGLTLRYLHKSRDLLAYLRVCDAAPCCFNSDSPYFDRGMQTSRWVYRLWRDPLSFAFSLVGAAGPVGFVFGGYALSPKPTLLLHGVYLKRQSAGLRADVVGAIEQRLAAPLGIQTIGVACLHGGAGDLPAGYVYGERVATRLRALEDASHRLETRVYDDISTVVNEEATLRLHWREL